MQEAGLTVESVSRFHATAPIGPKQPRYVNAAVRVRTSLSPDATLALLHQIEAAFGRVRRKRWGARALDLDLIGYGDHICPSRLLWGKSLGFTLPHPRAHQRSFVLAPLREVAARWRHPIFNLSVAALTARQQRPKPSDRGLAERQFG
jgi:2-amino-4-hydroxy-6-hydroxymethyldihydropteridine diphosphokinase